jgi:hypothetical protein
MLIHKIEALERAKTEVMKLEAEVRYTLLDLLFVAVCTPSPSFG